MTFVTICLTVNDNTPHPRPFKTIKNGIYFCIFYDLKNYPKVPLMAENVGTGFNKSTLKEVH